MLIWGLFFQGTTTLLRVTMRPLTNKTLSNLLWNLNKQHLRVFFQVPKGELPLKSIIANQGVPHHFIYMYIYIVHIGHWIALKTKSFRSCHIIHKRPLLKKSQYD